MEETVQPHTNCNHCKKQVVLTYNNCTACTYWYQPWFIWIRFLCLQCGQESRQFTGIEWQTQAEALTEAGLTFHIEDFAPDSLIKEYGKVYEKTMVEESELTDRQEHQVEFLAYLLEHEDFASECEQPQPARDQPLEWR